MRCRGWSEYISALLLFFPRDAVAVIVEAFSSTASRLENEASHFAMFTDYQVDEELFTSAMATAHLIRAHRSESWTDENDSCTEGKATRKTKKERFFGKKRKTRPVPPDKRLSGKAAAAARDQEEARVDSTGNVGKKVGSESNIRDIPRVGADGLPPTSDTYSGSGAQLDGEGGARGIEEGNVSDSESKEGAAVQMRRYFGIIPRRSRPATAAPPSTTDRLHDHPQSSCADSADSYVPSPSGRGIKAGRRGTGKQARQPLGFLRRAVGRRRLQRHREGVAVSGGGANNGEVDVLLQERVPDASGSRESGSMPMYPAGGFSAAWEDKQLEEEIAGRQDVDSALLLKQGSRTMRADALHSRPGPHSSLERGDAETKGEERSSSEMETGGRPGEYSGALPSKPRSASAWSERPGLHVLGGGHSDSTAWGSPHEETSWRVNSLRRRTEKGDFLRMPTRQAEGKPVTVPNNLDQAFTEVMPDSPYIELTRYHPLQILGARHVQLAMRVGEGSLVLAMCPLIASA